MKPRSFAPLLVLAFTTGCTVLGKQDTGEQPCADGYGRASDGNCYPLDEADTDTDTDTDTDAGAEEGEISDDAQGEVAALIEAAAGEDWPDGGGPAAHRLPFEEGVHMGVSYGTSCSSHAGALEGSLDFTVTGDYESAHAIVAAASEAGTVYHVTRDVPGHDPDGECTYGNYVLLRHADGSFSLYAHLTYGEVYVQEGDEVCAGQPLGLMGQTGCAWGEHLHYEQRSADNVIDPSPEFAEPIDVPEGCNECTTSTHTKGCYASENALECGGCTGEITSVEMNGSFADVVGWVQCPDTVEKWSLVVDASTVASEYPGTSYAEVRVTLDLGSFAAGDHTLGLWVRDETGTSDLMDSDTVTIGEDCASHAYQQCDGAGDVYWFDACGEREEIADDCSSAETCTDTSSTSARCEAVCTEADYWAPTSITDDDEGATADGTSDGRPTGVMLEVEIRDDGTGDLEFRICKPSGNFSGHDLWVVFDEDALGAGIVFEDAVPTSSSSTCTSWTTISTSGWGDGDDFSGNMHIESPSSSGVTWGSGCADDGSTVGDCWFMGSFGRMTRTCL